MSGLIGVLGVVFLIFLGVGGYEYFRLQTEISEFEAEMADLFYEIKNLELAIARLPPEQSKKMRTKLSDMEVRYSERFEEIANRRGETILSRLGVVEKPKISEEDRHILRMARLFGEYEFFAPKDFTNEVKAYIDKWRRSSRLSGAISRAQNNGYTRIIEEVMRAEYLPPQFFYLALQESDFKKNAVGPKTRYGIAKGIWQFIPGTAKQYGLRTGPLVRAAKVRSAG